MPLSRRQLLVDGLRVSALVPWLTRPGRRAPADDNDRVVVIVQLTGGNDGLNTIVPHRQDPYHRLRPTLALKRSSLHPLDDDHGLHPSLSSLREIYEDGAMTVVQGVGYPDPSRSHFRSLEIWQTGDPAGPGTGTGWLGRMADQISAIRPGAMPALSVGEEELPVALRGLRYGATSLGDERDLRLDDLPGLPTRSQPLLVDREASSGDLSFLRAAARDACAAAEQLEKVLARPRRSEYPDLELARKLSLVAKLVMGGFDTRIFLVTHGGFDTHARQVATHAGRLAELGESLAAFRRDLVDSGATERVLTLVHSEFGRRLAENGSRGTDHGAAGPVLLLGGPVRGGMRGDPPDLGNLEDGDVPYSTDFRALYSAVEQDWMRLAPSSLVPPFDLDS